MRLELADMEKELATCDGQLKASVDTASTIEVQSTDLTETVNKHSVCNT